MSAFNPPAANTANPYKEDGLNKIYNLLFCDDMALYQSGTRAEGYPWDVLFAATPDTDQLIKIVADTMLESRQRILGYKLLAEKNAPVNKKELLAVIVEVALPEGLDVLAAFADGSARYINHAEKLLIWENRTEESNQLIGQLFNESITVVNKIGPWEDARRPFPVDEMVRLSFLVADKLYFGEGPFDVLANDPMGGPVIDAATKLMAYLTTQEHK
jgi:hypothetical protein